jgi:hypothetical protein
LKSFEATNDGGYIFGGGTNNSPILGRQGFIQKCDKTGNVEWYKNYGDTLQDFFNCVHPTSDGGFIAAGATNSSGNGAIRKDYYQDAYAVKTDAQGNIKWQKTFGKIYNDAFLNILETPDHGYVAVGQIFDYSANTGYENRVYVVKMNQNGDSLWTQELFKGYFYSIGVSVAFGPNGEIAIAGDVVKSTYAMDQDTDYITFSYLSSDGKILIPGKIYSNFGILPKAYFATTYNYEKIIAKPDGFIFVANTTAPQNSVIIFKIDFSGNVLWHQRYSGKASASFNDAANNSTGGLLISGFTSDPVGNNYGWLLNTDPVANKIWEASFSIGGYTGWAARAVLIGNNYSLGVNLISPQVRHANFFGFLTIDQNGKIIENSK